MYISGYVTAVEFRVISGTTRGAISAGIDGFTSESIGGLTAAVVGGLTTIVKYLRAIGHHVYR